MTNTGFAAVAGGEILVKTVGPTEISAMVNYLWVYERMQVTNDWDDERVRETFAADRSKLSPRVAPVYISARI